MVTKRSSSPSPPDDGVVDLFRRELEAVSAGVKATREEVKRLRERLRSGESSPEELMAEMAELDKRADFFEARADQLEQLLAQLESYRPTLH